MAPIVALLFFPRTDASAKSFGRLPAFLLGEPALDRRLRHASLDAGFGYAVQDPESCDQSLECGGAVPVLRSRIGRDHPYSGW